MLAAALYRRRAFTQLSIGNCPNVVLENLRWLIKRILIDLRSQN